MKHLHYSAELDSKRRIEQGPSLRHLRLTKYAEELKMLDFEECWTAVENRDAGADGSFFYGVRTTGVYCRPGCASRRPLRANTLFFETTEAAGAAGFRACKRCRPTDGSAASRHLAAIGCPASSFSPSRPSRWLRAYSRGVTPVICLNTR